MKKIQAVLLTHKDLEKDTSILKNYIGKKCRFETHRGEVVENAEIAEYDWRIVLLHNEDIGSWVTGLKGEYKNAYVVITEEGEFNWEVNWIEIFEEPEFKEGEWILVRNEEDDEWEKRIFLYKDKNWYFIAVVHGDEENYLRWEEYETYVWKEGKKMDTIKIKTVDWQIVEVEKKKLEELGFRIVSK